MSKVAVCIASFNNAQFLPVLFDSVADQTFKDFHVYVSYDGSTDNTLEVLQGYADTLPLTIVEYGEKPGIGLNKNKVVTRALEDNPTYIQMLDADDYIDPGFLQAVVDRLDQGDVDWVICWGQLFGAREGYIHSVIEPLEQLKELNKRHSWGSFKAEVLREHNYDPEITYAEDWDLWIRLDEAGYKGDVVEQELYHKRWHDGSLMAVEGDRGYEEAKARFANHAASDGRQHFRFHLLGLVHLPVSERYMGCAFTQKIVKLSKMLLSLGHEVYIYGAETSDAPCTEFIETHTVHDIKKEWGDGDNRYDVGYNWRGWGFRHDFNKEKTTTTHKFYDNAIEAIGARKREDDFLLVMQGQYHKPIADKLGLFLTAEPGIGYRGSFAAYRAFESAYLMNFMYGSENPRKGINGNWYNRVIPNYFDAKDFPFQEEKEDYFLFIGRMIGRKGILQAAQTVNHIGGKLLMAGQQDSEFPISSLPSCCEYIGYVEPEQRAKLMGKARAVFVPTLYLEAFGGVNVEAQLCGTPVITTNFGVFPETVVHGVTGFRCDVFADFVHAAREVHNLDPFVIRKHAERYLMDNVRWEFHKWFGDLYELYRSRHKPGGTKWGWYYLQELHT